MSEKQFPKKSKYIKVSFPLKEIDLELLNAELYWLGSLGSVEKEGLFEAYFDLEKRIDLEFILEKLYLNQGLKPNYTIEVIETENWQTKWYKYFKAVRLTPKIGVRPPWRKFRKPLPIEIVIYPGMAFGTGTHATTQLALILLEKYLTPGFTVLDAGCGSGILTIAALKLGAKFVEAWDIDPDVRENFQINQELNQIGSNWKLNIGDILEKETWNYDLVISNIEKRVNIQLFQRIVDSGARPLIIFTGLLSEDYQEFAKLVLNYGRQIIAKRVKQEWLAIVVQ